jgi:hypothetical protein
MDILKDYYQDLDKLVDKFIASPYTGLLLVGLFILFITFMLIITRITYSGIVKMIDEGEARAIELRIEEWGEMIVNNLQQKCMEKKLSLTIYIIILPLLSIAMIGFSVYQLNVVNNLIVTVIHLFVLLTLFLFIKLIRKGLTRKKNQSKKENQNVKEEQ